MFFPRQQQTSDYAVKNEKLYTNTAIRLVSFKIKHAVSFSHTNNKAARSASQSFSSYRSLIQGTPLVFFTSWMRMARDGGGARDGHGTGGGI